MAETSQDSIVLEEASENECTDQTVQTEDGVAVSVSGHSREKIPRRKSGASTCRSKEPDFSVYSSGQDSSQPPPLYQFGQGASIPPISRNMPFMARSRDQLYGNVTWRDLGEITTTMAAAVVSGS